MKCVCISCFDYFDIRMQSIIDFFREQSYDVTYLIADFNHFSKKSYVVNYRSCKTIQLHVPQYRNNLSVARLLSHFVFSQRVYSQLKEIAPDVIYCVFPPNSLVKQAVRYKRESGAKLIFDCFDMWPESMPIRKYQSLLKYPFKAWGNLRDKYISEADLLVCVSRTAKAFLEERATSVPIEVILPMIKNNAYPNYDFSRISYSFDFCYLGLINHITDIELGVRFLSSLQKHRPVTLHIIGEGQNIQLFVDQLKEKGVNVVCHGVVFEEDEKNKIFSCCDFGLNIPKREVQSSMSLKSIEYLKVGLPYVNTGIGDSWETVQDHCCGINLDVRDMEQAVSEILRIDSEELKNLHQNCIRVYEERFANQNLERVFQSVLLK